MALFLFFEGLSLEFFLMQNEYMSSHVVESAGIRVQVKGLLLLNNYTMQKMKQKGLAEADLSRCGVGFLSPIESFFQVHPADIFPNPSAYGIDINPNTRTNIALRVVSLPIVVSYQSCIKLSQEAPLCSFADRD